MWGYEIKDPSGRTIKKGKTYSNSSSARKSAHTRLHKSDIPKGSYSEVSKINKKKKVGLF